MIFISCIAPPLSSYYFLPSLARAEVARKHILKDSQGGKCVETCTLQEVDDRIGPTDAINNLTSSLKPHNSYVQLLCCRLKSYGRHFAAFMWCIFYYLHQRYEWLSSFVRTAPLGCGQVSLLAWHSLKGTVHTIMKNLSFVQPRVVPNLYTFLCTEKKIFWKMWKLKCSGTLDTSVLKCHSFFLKG